MPFEIRLLRHCAYIKFNNVCSLDIIRVPERHLTKFHESIKFALKCKNDWYVILSDALAMRWELPNRLSIYTTSRLPSPHCEMTYLVACTFEEGHALLRELLKLSPEKAMPGESGDVGGTRY